MKPKNDWEDRFGAKRRASDKALLEALERQIGDEEKDAARQRESIARAFGRPLDRTRK